ncbi:MAG: PepSY-associated TM helix domain-containing protein [Kangiellaceae bacterium]
MSRKLMITIHLALSAFFTPILIIIAISGGLYLLGEKGSKETEIVYQGEMNGFTFKTDDRESQVNQFLKSHHIDHSFEYVKGGGRFMVTRPTSKTYLQFEKENNQLIVKKVTPDFVASIIEIHKGHGPTSLKLFQKILAVGLLLILLTGFYLGVTSPMLKLKTLAISGSGLLVFLLLTLM